MVLGLEPLFLAGTGRLPSSETFVTPKLRGDAAATMAAAMVMDSDSVMDDIAEESPELLFWLRWVRSQQASLHQTLQLQRFRSRSLSESTGLAASVSRPCRGSPSLAWAAGCPTCTTRTTTP